MVVETGSPGSVHMHKSLQDLDVVPMRSASWHHMPLRICRGGADVTRVLPRSAFYGNPALLGDSWSTHSNTNHWRAASVLSAWCLFQSRSCRLRCRYSGLHMLLPSRNINGTEDWLKVTRSCGADAARRVLEPRLGHHKFRGPATF
jgi:hypothetical protein